MTEEEFQQSIIEFAWIHRWKTYHTRNSRGSTAGFPDLVLTKPGYLIFAELKTGERKVTPEQRDWIDALDSICGDDCVQVYVWRPKDWPEIEAVLKQ